MYRATPAPRAWNDLIGVVCGSSWPWRSLGSARRRLPSECRAVSIVRMYSVIITSFFIPRHRPCSIRAAACAFAARPRPCSPSPASSCAAACCRSAAIACAARLPPLPPGGDADNDVVDARAGATQLRCGPVAAIGRKWRPGAAPAAARRRGGAPRPNHRRLGSRSDGTARPPPAGRSPDPPEPEPEPERGWAARRGSSAISLRCEARRRAVRKSRNRRRDPPGFGSGTAGSGTTGRGSRDPPGGTGSGGAPSMVNGIEEAESVV